MIIQVETTKQIGQIRKLFREYENWLGVDLCFQSFEEELKNLPGKYAPASGRLFLAMIDEKPAGCIAVRKLETEICEMKRLYVRGEFRGTGLGRELIEKAFEAAREIGYAKMRLDTLSHKMPKAVALYEHYGFYEIPPYYNNPHTKTLFLEKIL